MQHYLILMMILVILTWLILQLIMGRLLPIWKHFLAYYGESPLYLLEEKKLLHIHCIFKLSKMVLILTTQIIGGKLVIMINVSLKWRFMVYC